LKALKEAYNRFLNELKTQSNQRAAEKNAFIESTGKVLNINNPLLDKPQEKQKLFEDGEVAFITTADESKLNAYRTEIKHTRQQRDLEMRLRKELIEKILSTWKDLKDIRFKQSYRNTDLKLVIKK
jgi:hypothetical protein